MVTDSEDPQELLRAHNIGSLDVDWLINARNLNTDNPNPLSAAEVKNGRSEGNSKTDLSRKAVGSSGKEREKTPNELPPDDPASPLHINANLPKQKASGDEVPRRRSNSVVGISGPLNSNEDSSSTALRKTKSLSAASPDPRSHTSERRSSLSRPSNGNNKNNNGSSPKKEKKMGFFKSLFGGRKKKDSSVSPAPPAVQPPHDTAASSRRSSVTSGSFGSPLTRSKTASIASSDKSQQERQNNNHHQLFYHRDLASGSNSAPLGDSSDSSISHVRTQSATNFECNGRDPRLIEFLEYYKTHGYPVSAFRKRDSSEKREVGAKPSGPGANFQFRNNINDSIDDADHVPLGGVRYDVRGRPLPHHPRKSNLPPALRSVRAAQVSSRPVTQSEQTSDSESDHSAPLSSSNRFGSFLKKVTAHGGGTSPATSVSPTRSTHSPQFDPTKVKDVPGLENMRPLKHVSFANNTYFNDPPQQICSKNPRQGEVEVKSNGSVVVHRLSPEERRKVMENSSAGIVVGGSGQLKLLTQRGDEDVEGKDPRKQEQMAPGRGRGDLLTERRGSNSKDSDGESDLDEEEEAHSSAQGRDIKRAAAEAAAEARAKGTPNDLFRANNDEEVGVSNIAKRVTIDKPMVSRRSFSSTSSLSLSSMASVESDDEILPPPCAKIPHDVVYTRCCHLREILPIPATLKQLTPGSTDPIPLLQLRNPKPSSVEIWSFSDFLSIAPVLCLSLDGVSLSVDMLKIVLASVSGKKGFEKLSLRNTPIDGEGWQVLCYFVSKSKDLAALDLTMVPQIKTNVQKPSRSSLKSTIVRMESSPENRRDMNWDLLAASVAAKGGLEEVVVSGAQMPPEQFENFIDVACINTTRLGLAYNGLSRRQCQSLTRWLVQSKFKGLDLGFNNLKGKISALNDVIWDKVYNKRERNLFRYVSLNCTGLEVDAGDVSETNEVLKLMSLLCYCEDLKFLDISNNPKMFPHCINTLIDCLPVCVNLTRLHLDYESLAPTSVVTLAEALPLCTRLNYLSMLGTKFDLASYKALADAVKKSPSLITLDVDYTGMSPNIKKKVSLYTMRNVDNELNRVRASSGGGYNGEKAPISSLQEELSKLLTGKIEDERLYHVLVQKYVQKVNVVRSKIGKVVKDLFAIRIQGELSVEGKEALIRLCFVDANLDKRLTLLQEREQSVLQSQDHNSFYQEPSGSPSLFDKSHSNSTLDPSCMVPTPPLDHAAHSALLPFGRAEVEAGQEQELQADDTVELVEKDEPNYHLHGPVYGLKQDEALDKEQLCKAAESLNTDKIKDYLMKSDVGEMVNIIDELHNQGYHLPDIFKKPSKNSSCLASLSPKLTPIKPRRSSSSLNSNSSYKSAGTGSDTLKAKPSSDSLKAVRAEDEAIDVAYDHVLDNLERERI